MKELSIIKSLNENLTRTRTVKPEIFYFKIPGLKRFLAFNKLLCFSYSNSNLSNFFLMHFYYFSFMTNTSLSHVQKTHHTFSLWPILPIRICYIIRNHNTLYSPVKVSPANQPMYACSLNICATWVPAIAVQQIVCSILSKPF